MAFFCSNPPIFRYSGTPLKNVREFEYLGMTLSHTGKMINVSNQMARNFARAIARAWRNRSELGIKNRKHAMLWIFQVFALSARLYGCQVLATGTLIFKSAATTKAHIHHVRFLKMLFEKWLYATFIDFKQLMIVFQDIIRLGAIYAVAGCPTISYPS